MSHRALNNLPLFFFLVGFPLLAGAETWRLPQELNDSNTTVSFSVESTWHQVEGRTTGITGTIKLSDRRDPLSVVAEVSIPTRLFDTGWGLRDERLQDVLAAERFPTVHFVSSRLSPECAPLRIKSAGSCQGYLEGVLTIRDVSKNVQLPLHILKKDGVYQMEGELKILWGDYNVEDPSILIAKLEPVVAVSMRTTVFIETGDHG